MSALGLAVKGAQLYLGAQMVGLEMDPMDVVRWGNRLLKVADALGPHARAVDERALAEMVELARSRVPVSTAYLQGQISGVREGDEFVFSAIAHRQKDGGKQGVDYGPFVEFGTKPGNRDRAASRADSRLVNRAAWDEAHPESSARPGRFFDYGRRLRRVYHPHPGTAAQPFFYNSAREVLERRGIAHENMLARATAEDA